MSEVEESFVPRRLTPEEKQLYKRLLITFGVFTGLLLVFFAVLVLFVSAGRASWERGLTAQVAGVVREQALEYELGSLEAVSSPFAVSCAAVPLYNAGSREAVAVILRVATLYGPQAAVYLYRDGATEAEFLTFLTLNEKTEQAIRSSAANSQLAYWARRIPRILATGREEAERDEAE